MRTKPSQNGQYFLHQLKLPLQETSKQKYHKRLQTLMYTDSQHPLADQMMMHKNISNAELRTYRDKSPYGKSLNNSLKQPTKTSRGNKNASMTEETMKRKSSKWKNILEIAQTSSTVRGSGQQSTKKMSFTKNRRNDHRNSNPITKKLNIHDFQFLQQLGKGKYGKVYMVRHKQTGFLLALKEIQKNIITKQKLTQQLINQIKIQAFICHPNIIKLYGFFDDDDCLYLLLELGCDGQLYQHMQKHLSLREQSVSLIAKNLLEAICHLHYHKVLHRDIKPQNIVLVLGHVKLCDFGWASYSSAQMRQTFCGTPLYFSPELLKGQKYNEKVDIWAIGILVFELISGRAPFNLKLPTDLPNIVVREVSFPTIVSPQLKDFIERMLMKNPNNRQEGRDLLDHPFLQQYNQLEICSQLC